MGIFKKVVGVIFALLGLFLLLISFVGDFSIGIFVAAVLALLVAAFFFKKPKPKTTVEPTERPAPAPERIDEAVESESPSPFSDLAPSPAAAASRSYSFKVAGISFRQKDLDDVLLDNYEYDMSKSELIDLGMTDERIYKYIDVVGDVSLVPEPDNAHDPNAIKVCVNDVHVGYVPSEKAKRVKKILDTGDPSLSCEVVGGPYKIIREDYDDDKGKDIYRLEKNNMNIGIEVTLHYS